MSKSNHKMVFKNHYFNFSWLISFSSKAWTFLSPQKHHIKHKGTAFQISPFLLLPKCPFQYNNNSKKEQTSLKIAFWKVKVPTKIAFFTWTAALGKVLTIDNLHSIRFVLMIGAICVGELGKVDHQILHRACASELWSLIFLSFWSPIGYAI